MPGSVYFITFKAVDGFKLGGEGKDIVFESIKFHAGRKYELYGCVIMETHAHVILKPLVAQAGTPVLPLVGARRTPAEGGTALNSLAGIMHSIKSYSANRIQKVLHRKGSIWLDESYDRVIRDEKEYIEKMSYIINNPVKAGLVERPEDYKWLYFLGMADKA